MKIWLFLLITINLYALELAEETALITAIAQGKTQELESLLTSLGTSFSINDPIQGQTLLQRALLANDPLPGIISTLLEHGANPNQLLPFGDREITPLLYALRKRLVHIAYILAEQSAPETLDIPDPETGLTPLVVTIINHLDDTAEVLIKRVKDVNLPVTTQHQRNAPPLFFALYTGNIPMMRALFNRGASLDFSVEEIDGESVQHTSALFAVMQSRNIDAIKVFLAYCKIRGIDINHAFIDTYPPLMFAIHMGFINIVKTLLDSGIKISALPPNFNPLHTAIMQYADDPETFNSIIKILIRNINEEIQGPYRIPPVIHNALVAAIGQNMPIAAIRAILESDPRLYDISINGMNMAQYAAATGNLEVLRLVARRFSIDEYIHSDTPVDGNTALTLSILYNHYPIVEYLLAEGANANRPQLHSRWTPLMLAANRGYIDLVELLLHQPHVDIQATTPRGYNALHLLLLNRRSLPDTTLRDIARLLIHAGIDINSPTDRGHTALQFLIDRQAIRPQTIAYLLQNGSNPNLMYNNRTILSEMLHTTHNYSDETFRQAVWLVIYFGGHVSGRHDNHLVRNFLAAEHNLLTAVTTGNISEVMELIQLPQNSDTIMRALLIAIGQGQDRIVQILFNEYHNLEYDMEIPSSIIPHEPSVVLRPIDILGDILAHENSPYFLNGYQAIAEFLAQRAARRMYAFITQRGQFRTLRHSAWSQLPAELRYMIQEHMHGPLPKYFRNRMMEAFHSILESGGITHTTGPTLQELTQYIHIFKSQYDEGQTPDVHQITHLIERVLRGDILNDEYVDKIKALIQCIHPLDPGLYVLLHMVQRMLAEHHRHGPYEKHVLQIIQLINDRIHGEDRPGPAPRLPHLPGSGS